ncbi:Toxin CSTX-10 like [Actinidia chinensis var. chinensis]|uniref:Toxin CSTX-10 like n=1 Tax=Actinidia chinensis var. chinensis TaxID=1590841 RepID=A0A2R6R5Y3_ACTCC|nr:Toxin CSTX-10 like [Actinidia chinensis var. chinensis]
MEANSCHINHLDSNVLLPPRKRLLAGLKKQNSDGNPRQSSTSDTLSEFDTRLNNLLRSHLNNPNLSPEEIVEVSRSAAAAAAKAAEVTRAAAEEKAVTAAKAIAAAKSALKLVATVSETGKERYLKKNRMKKHVPVHMLYNKHGPAENSTVDEELARKLHRAINSSPRISKNSSTSESKNSKHKRLKVLSPQEKTRVSDGGIAWEGNRPSTSNGNGVTVEVDSEGSIHEAYTLIVDENESKFSKADRLTMDRGEVERRHSKEKNLESSDGAYSIGRKRGRIKKKKLPLTICSFRDWENPNKELRSVSSPLTEDNTGKTTSNNMPLVSVGPYGVRPVEITSTWKCQAFKAATSVNHNKVKQS